MTRTRLAGQGKRELFRIKAARCMANCSDLSMNWGTSCRASRNASKRRKLFTAANVEEILDRLQRRVDAKWSRATKRSRGSDEPLVWWMLGVLLGLSDAGVGLACNGSTCREGLGAACSRLPRGKRQLTII